MFVTEFFGAEACRDASASPIECILRTSPLCGEGIITFCALSIFDGIYRHVTVDFCPCLCVNHACHSRLDPWTNETVLLEANLVG